MKIGSNLWLGYEPLYLAAKNGYLDKKSAHLVEYTSASQVIMAYRNAAIDAAALTLDEALLLLENKFDPKIVLIFEISNGADAIISQPTITRIEQLKGKRIGVEDTALGAYLLSRAFEIHHLSLSDVSIVAMEPDKQAHAFTNQDVDAVVTFEPLKSKLLAKGANSIFDSSQIPHEIVDVLVVSQQYLAQHQDKVAAVKSAWFKALAYMKKHPEKAASIMRNRQRLSLQDFDNAYKGINFPDQKENHDLLDSAHSRSLWSVSKKLSKVMFDRKLLREPIDTRSLFTGTLGHD